MAKMGFSDETMEWYAAQTNEWGLKSIHQMVDDMGPLPEWSPDREADRRKADQIRNAAPKLLEALKEMVSEYVDVCSADYGGYWRPFDPEQDECVIKARAAIKAAEGE